MTTVWFKPAAPLRLLALLVCLSCLLLVQTAIAAAEQPAMIELSDGDRGGPINDRVDYLIESGTVLSLEDIRDRIEPAQFRRVERSEPDFGYIPEGIWLRIALHNASDMPLKRFLMMRTNFMSEISVWFTSDTRSELLLEQDRASTFGDRPIRYHELIAPLTLAPGESGEIYIRYASQGDTVLPLAIVDEVGLATATNSQLIVDFAFYGLMAMVIIASLGVAVFFRSATFFTYAIYCLAVLVLIFQRDGYAFQFLWPNAPAWNDFSSLPVGAGLPFFAAIFTRTYLKTRTLHPVIDKVLIAVVLLQIAVVASALIVGAAQAKQLALISVSISIIVFISIGIVALRKYGRGTWFFLIGWTGLFAGTLTMTIIHWTDIEISRAQSLNVMRVSMVFDALMMGLAAIFQIVDLQRERNRLERERSRIVESNLRLRHRFDRLERNYNLAQSIARSRSEVVTDLTHDLQQPLFALRSAVNDMTATGARDMPKAEIEQAFDYIESLVDSALEDALQKEDHGGGLSDKDHEATQVAEVFTALKSMFSDDAAANAVELKSVDTTSTIGTDPFPVLRIMSNFVANAIRYAPNRRVLIGARRRGNGYSLEVHDTGEGMSEDMLATVKIRSERGAPDETEGHGIGLSIVSKLAREHGLSWSLESNPGRGTIARLQVPAAQDV